MAQVGARIHDQVDLLVMFYGLVLDTCTYLATNSPLCNTSNFTVYEGLKIAGHPDNRQDLFYANPVPKLLMGDCGDGK